MTGPINRNGQDVHKRKAWDLPEEEELDSEDLTAVEKLKSLKDAWSAQRETKAYKAQRIDIERNIAQICFEAASGWLDCNTPEADKEAAHLVRLSAYRFYPAGCFVYGELLKQGRGVSRNEQQSMYWFEKAVSLSTTQKNAR